MHFITLNINRAERPRGAEVLASTAADAFVLVDGGDLYRAVWAFVVHHLDGACRAVACAVATRHTFFRRQAVLLNPHGMTNMLHGLLFPRDGLDGACGTHLAASCTFGAAIAALERHGRLHEMLQIGRGAQHVVRAARHAKLAGCAMLLHVARRDRSGRRDGCRALRGHLVLDDG